MSDKTGIEGNLSQEEFDPVALRSLEQLREKLLDLTPRNQLLNFTHSRARRRYIRIVDELPDRVFRALVDDEKSMSLAWIPRPARQASDDEDDDQSPDARVKREAIRHGIDPDYELPLPEEAATGDEIRKPRNNRIQTLLFPEDLDAIARSVAAASRRAIEESGVNYLFMSLGFLEWRDREKSANYFAPLVLLPIGLEKSGIDSRTRRFTFKVSYTGEDVAENIALKHKLREFGLDLPAWAEDDTPESYFAKLKPIFRAQPEWSLRRFATIALLRFSKIIMHADLDPAVWKGKLGAMPGGKLVNHLLGGAPIDRPAGQADDEKPVHIDDLPAIERDLWLIEDCDSSQHLAIVDALHKAKNLVVIGPPGTGKSQTITNLIAGAIHQGKSVLFVSEKLAALEVVRNRLGKAGLARFCLDLHSHQSTKQAIVASLKRRLQRAAESANGDLQSAWQRLNRDRKALNDHFRLLRAPFAATGKSGFEVIWAAARQRSELACAPADLIGDLLVGGEAPIAADIEEADIQTQNLLRVHDAACGRSERMSKHPWFGIRSAGLTALDRFDVVESLSKVRDAADNAMTAGLELAEAVPAIDPDRDGPIRQFIESVAALPEPNAGLWTDRLADWADANAHRTALEAVDIIDELRDASDGFRPTVSNAEALSGQMFREACDAFQAAEKCFDDASRAEELTTIESLAASLRRRLSELDSELQPYCQALSCAANSVSHFVALAGAFHCAKIAPFPALHLRAPLLDNGSTRTLLERAISDGRELLGHQELLDVRFIIAGIPETETLKAISAQLNRRGTFLWLRAEWRRAARVDRTIRRHSPPRSRKRAVEIDELARWAAARDRYGADAEYRTGLQSLFTGLETPFELLEILAQWYASVRRTLGYGFEGFGGMALRLLELPHESLEAMADSVMRHNSGYARLRDWLSDFDRLAAMCEPSAAELHGAAGSDLERVLDRIANSASHAREQMGKLSVAPEATIGDLKRLAPVLADHIARRDRLLADPKIVLLFGKYWNGLGTDTKAARRLAAWVESVESVGLPKSVTDALFTDNAVSNFRRIRTVAETARDRLERLDDAHRRFCEMTTLDNDTWLGGADFSFSALKERAERALQAEPRFSEMLDYCGERRRLEALGIKKAIVLLENGAIGGPAFLAAVRFVIYDALAQKLFRDQPDLRDAAGAKIDQIRSRFAENDRNIKALVREEIARAARQRRVPAGVGHGRVKDYTERALIDHVIEKPKARVTIRELMRRAAHAMQALKPCFMMSPLSVAQFLEPGKLTFDIVIMDEASQLRPEDALGALLRSRQAVIVGDPKQLPPTDFFQRAFGRDDENEADEAGGIVSARSILDEAKTRFGALRMLQWHYRSRHGSLIHWSNRHFYQDDLIIFPAAVAEGADLGVKFVHVVDGAYANSRNPPEARRIARDAIEFMRNEAPKAQPRTLGVVAMNQDQADLIDDEIDRLLRADSIAQEYVAACEKGQERFFVKNLENVQGDERDFIFVSITYGPGADGRVAQTFGPINQSGGPRRLNVLFTRARQKLVAYSSMLPRDIVVEPGRAVEEDGRRALREYLAYARGEGLEKPVPETKPPDSHFEIAVTAVLRRRGFGCHAQVGHGGFRIDLAVVDPNDASAYVLGVECDGAPYHSGKSARDRDRLRQFQLEQLGWRIHRIWSRDWYGDPERETERLVRAVLDAIASRRTAKANEASQANAPIPDSPAASYVPEETNERRPTARSPKSELQLQRTPQPAPTQRVLPLRPATLSTPQSTSQEIGSATRQDGAYRSSSETLEAARQKLIELRDRIQREMRGDPLKNPLRKELLDELLFHRPTNLEEFQERIPRSIREKIDGRQFNRYMDDIFEMIEGIE